MAITLNTLKGYLDNIGLKYEVLPDRESSPIIQTSWGSDDGQEHEVGEFSFAVFISLDEQAGDGFEWINFNVRGLARDLNPSLDPNQPGSLKTIAPGKYSAFLQFCAEQNYRKKIGRWGFDPSDGDFIISCAVPLEDSTLTEKQVRRIMASLVKTGRENYVALRRLVSHGDASKPLLRLDANTVAELAVALATSGDAELVSHAAGIAKFAGDIDALLIAVRARDWSAVKGLLSPVVV